MNFIIPEYLPGTAVISVRPFLTPTGGGCRPVPVLSDPGRTGRLTPLAMRYDSISKIISIVHHDSPHVLSTVMEVDSLIPVLRGGIHAISWWELGFVNTAY